MKKYFILIIAIVAMKNMYAQSKDTTTNLSSLDNVNIYSTRFVENKKKVAQTITNINKDVIQAQSNTADVLINSGAAFVQKSQQGGGSPVIRGFEASRILLTIDGIRMNNAIYRAGHLQNIITVDNMNLDKMEVQFGPSSTVSGSDALGGSINMFTKIPFLSSSNKILVSGNATVKYASAIEENRGHAEVNIGSKEWAALTSVTYGKFGDVTQGSNRKNDYPDFGKQNFIVQRWGNTDSAFVNPNPNKQSPSGYKQIDVMQKFLYQPKDNIQHVLNLQFSNTNDIPRYDRLTETTSGSPTFAQWNYGPQIRNLVAYHLKANKLSGFVNDLNITVNYQDVEESRITRRFKNNNRDSRVERVNVFGVNIDAKHYTKNHTLQFGVESYMNFVASTARRDNILTGGVSRISTRYSDGPTKQKSNAAYFQHSYTINDKLTLNDGVRLSHVKLDAIFADTALLHLPFNRASQYNTALTGNIGLVYNHKKIRVAALVNSGFRSPNVDDLTKVFDTRAGYIVVPNNSLKPEFTYNAEINFSHQINNFNYGAAFYYTWFSNAIVVDKFTFNGMDSIDFQGIKSGVFAPQNKAKAVVYGYNLYANWNFTKNTFFEAMYNYTYGEFTNANSTVPLDHIPPAYGKLAINHKQAKCYANASILFNSWKRIDMYNPTGEDNAQYATKEGMPSWYILNLYTGYKLHKQLHINFAIENILDRNYRYFASGISAPGRNFIISLTSSF
jgi:hemoglobin/transferrin/lactoferrin receptor protein